MTKVSGKNHLVIIAALAVGLSACATKGTDRFDQNRVISTYFAELRGVENVELSSNVPVGIAWGAAEGAVEGADEGAGGFFAGMVIGGIIGGIFTAIFEGSNDAYEYTLHHATKGPFKVIQKEKLSTDTGCVEVREGAKVTLKPVPLSFCSA